MYLFTEVMSSAAPLGLIAINPALLIALMNFTSFLCDDSLMSSLAGSVKRKTINQSTHRIHKSDKQRIPPGGGAGSPAAILYN